ncbi:hypothetical protein EYC84_005655 [Monilinia fructicola]|uniref:Uncharacterized protein n=1 Tax=Monilinia fructicola TaxID=38448 RepID=A0A5M9K1X8_MONFR|nr:hypothetical protein EYC84_005655 [Monilinia fructicola]
MQVDGYGDYDKDEFQDESGDENWDCIMDSSTFVSSLLIYLFISLSAMPCHAMLCYGYKHSGHCRSGEDVAILSNSNQPVPSKTPVASGIKRPKIPRRVAIAEHQLCSE